ncbi:DUF6249 domain-containing protein [Roseivirga sp. BDSF3-8]|uniref:DUF6249 domain-containing protein n=1 Tax=Roseivirga sp. BDSF3-8 TaxID=3241598 RepID=UPI0035327875
MNETHAIVLGASLSLSIVLVVYIVSKYNYLIQKARIEQGEESQRPGNQYKYLEYGCVLLGLGTGLGVSSIFTLMPLSEDAMDLLVWATILIFGGLGLILAHSVRRKQESGHNGTR